MSVRQFNDKWGYRPLIMGQCTCSRTKWEEKQGSISYDIWAKRLGNLPRYIEIMWLPFSICGADGMPENPGYIRTCIMDRYRILEVANGNEDLMPEIEFSDMISEELLAQEA